MRRVGISDNLDREDHAATSRSDEAGTAIETHEHAGDFMEL